MAVIEVNHVTKEFRLGQLHSLKQSALDTMARLRGLPVSERAPFKALDDVDFKVERGEVLGIIGQNGAGKSTLLKMLARISNPTRGSVKVDGTVAPLIEVGCWAHARRYFKEAMPTAAVPCAQALAIIRQLYGIERAASDRQLDAPARQGLRQEQARPMLEKLHAYLQEQRAAALPKSPLGAASGYALRNWVASPQTAGSKSTTTELSRRSGRSCSAAKIGSSRGAKQRRTEPPSCVRWSRPASTCRSIRSCICAM